MNTVVGTPIASLAACAQAILVSDLHLPADGGAVLESLRGVIAAARDGGASVFVLGDLFDSYVCRAQVRHGVWREVASLLATAAAAGVAVVLLHGNRDFLLGDEFAAASGARIVAGGVRVRLGNVDTLLLHGDELCQNDLPYQRAKRWLRSAPVRGLARRLPLRWALRVAERARRRSRMVIARGDQTRFLPTAAAVGEALASGVDRLVFGHIHRHAHDRMGPGEYWVLPAFDSAATGLWIAPGTVQSVRFTDGQGGHQSLPAPGPCPLSPRGPA